MTVTAEDGTTTRTYSVTVMRAAALPEVSVAAVEERLTGPIGAFTLTRTGPTGESLDVRVRRWNSRTETSATSTVRIHRGRDSVTRRVQAGDNNLVEDDIEMRWTLLAGEDYMVSAEQGSASLVLLESDVPEFSVSAASGGAGGRASRRRCGWRSSTE